MSNARPRVVVLYSHSLLGEGLARLIADEQGLDVAAVDISDEAAVAAAIASHPDVIVVEEGGRLDGIDVLREAGSPVVVDVDIRSTDAWAFHRDAIASRPESVLEAIREAVGLGGHLGGHLGGATLGGSLGTAPTEGTSPA